MTLEFIIKNQSITRTDKERPAADSKNYLYARFSFSEDWEAADKLAIFECDNGDPYSVLLENDKCIVPHEVIRAPCFRVSVRGDCADDDMLITVNQARVSVCESGAKCGLTPQPPTPDVYAVLLQNTAEAVSTAQNAEKIAQSVRDDADSGALGSGVPVDLESLLAEHTATDGEVNEMLDEVLDDTEAQTSGN